MPKDVYGIELNVTGAERAVKELDAYIKAVERMDRIGKAASASGGSSRPTGLEQVIREYEKAATAAERLAAVQKGLRSGSFGTVTLPKGSGQTASGEVFGKSGQSLGGSAATTIQRAVEREVERRIQTALGSRGAAASATPSGVVPALADRLQILGQSKAAAQKLVEATEQSTVAQRKVTQAIDKVATEEQRLAAFLQKEIQAGRGRLFGKDRVVLDRTTPGGERVREQHTLPQLAADKPTLPPLPETTPARALAEQTRFLAGTADRQRDEALRRKATLSDADIAKTRASLAKLTGAWEKEAQKPIFSEAQKLRAAQGVHKLTAAMEREANELRIAEQLRSRTAHLGSGGLITDSAGERYTRSGKPASATQRALADTPDHPPNFGQGLQRGFFGKGLGGGGAKAVSGPEILGNLGISAGTTLRYTALYSLLGNLSQAFTDTVNEAKNFTDSVTDINVAMEGAGRASEGFITGLTDVSRLAGSNVGESLDAASRGIRAFRDETDGSIDGIQALGRSVAYTAGQLSVIAGIDLDQASTLIVATGKSFALTSNELGQVTDAISNAKRLGGDYDEIAKGLSTASSPLAKAGFTIKESANLIGAVTAQTAQSGQTVATQLSRIIDIAGGSGAQTVLSDLGINTQAAVRDQLAQLSEIMRTGDLSEGQKRAVESRLAGTGNLRTFQATLDQNFSELDAGEAGAGLDEFNRKANDLVGTLRKLAGDFTNLQTNIVRSGFVDVFGVALKAAEPLLRTVADLVGLFAHIPEPFRGVIAGAAEAYLAFRLLKGQNLAGFFTGIRDTAGATGRALLGIPQKKAVAEAVTTTTTNLETGAVQRNIVVTEVSTKTHLANAEAKGVDAAASQALAAAELKQAAATGVATRASAGEAAAGLVGGSGFRARGKAGIRAGLDPGLIGGGLRSFADRVERPVGYRLTQDPGVLGLRREAGAGPVGRGTAGVVRGGAAAVESAAGTRVLGGLAAAGSALLGPLGLIVGVTGASVALHGLADSAKAAAEARKAGADAEVGILKAYKPADYRGQADKFESAGAALDKSTHGFFGSIRYQADRIFGGGDDRKQAKEYEDLAKQAKVRAEEEAERLNAGAHSKRSREVFTDPGNVEALQAGMEALDTSGASAATKIALLTEAINGMGDAGKGAGQILPGQVKHLEQQLAESGSAVTRGAVEHVLDGSQKLKDALGERDRDKGGLLGKAADLLGDTTRGDAIGFAKNLFGRSNNADKRTDSQVAVDVAEGGGGFSSKDKDRQNLKVRSAFNRYIKAQGYEDGEAFQLNEGQMEDAAQKMAEAQAEDLKGLSDSQRKAFIKNQQAHFLAKLKDLTDPGKLIIDQTSADSISTLLDEAAETKRSQKVLTDGDEVGAAQDKVADIIKNQALTESKGRKVSEESGFRLLAAKRELAATLSAQADSEDVLAKAGLSIDDTIGRARIDLATSLRHQSEALARGDKKGANEAAAQAKAQEQQIAKEQIDLANAKGVAALDPRDATGGAREGLVAANRDLAGAGVGTKAWYDAQKTQKSAQLAVAKAELDDANAFRESSTRPGDATGAASDQLAAVNAQLKVTPAFKVGGVPSAEYSKLIKDKRQIQHDLVMSQVADAYAFVQAGLQPGDAVGEALAALDNVNAQLANTNRIGKDGQQTAEYSGLLKQQRELMHAAAMSEIAQGYAFAQAGLLPGDAVGEALAAFDNVSQQLANTNRLGDDGKQTAEYSALVKQQQDLMHAAVMSQVEQMNAFALARLDPRDTLGNARQAAQNARLTLANTTRLGADGQQTTEYSNAQVAVKAADLAAQQEQVAALNARDQAGVFSGDSLGGAQVAITAARRNLSKDLKYSAQWWNDLKALHDAQYQASMAQLEASKNARLLRIDITDPVAMAREEAQAARAKLALDAQRGAPQSVLDADRLSVRQAEASEEAARFNQRLSDAQTNDQLGRISHTAYLSYLKNEHDRLTAIGSRTRQQQDQLNQIDSAMKAANTQMQGQFNLGDIKVPTPYEVRRSIAGGGQQGSYATNTKVVTISINGADIGMVKRVLNDYLGAGATNRTGTSSRKVA